MYSFRVVRKQQVVACVEFIETSRGSGKCVWAFFFPSTENLPTAAKHASLALAKVSALAQLVSHTFADTPSTLV